MQIYFLIIPFYNSAVCTFLQKPNKSSLLILFLNVLMSIWTFVLTLKMFLILMICLIFKIKTTAKKLKVDFYCSFNICANSHYFCFFTILYVFSPSTIRTISLFSCNMTYKIEKQNFSIFISFPARDYSSWEETAQKIHHFGQLLIWKTWSHTVRLAEMNYNSILMEWVMSPWRHYRRCFLFVCFKWWRQ